ncbi:DUF4132 domain-containing protein [Micromonospora sp. WMMA1949]|uniref:DUF4132 domain-containing protein n=1 Tax=Micromonospora sp. WMMA1949 TaxID=3015162 RepID=UPI0022B6BFDA|nr:DUF4132 domain-containing protein [Micromonospora sp. WMMA1949]MCZ7429114.1 DUF4132 domain-containing protein [Micromonospora sp. WMMA1949]
MRRFEFVGGGSAKFWEVGQSDTTVTVRYGSIGSQGRTQVKELGSLAEAAAHADRLVAEKLRKGYAETTVAPSAGHTGAPAVEPTAPGHDPEAAGADPAGTGSAGSDPAGALSPAGELPDEDAFEVPGGWRRMLIPRRDGTPGPALPSAAKSRAAGRKLLDSLADHLASTARLSVDPELGPALRGYLDGRPGPLGGAALVAAVGTALDYRVRDQQGHALADLLVADLGPAGAAVAATEQITVAAAGHSSSFPLRRTEATNAHGYSHWRLRRSVMRRVRAHLAAAGDGDYAAAHAALAPYRSGPLPVRAATSFLLPTEREWVARDVADVAREGGPLLAELLLCAVDDVDAVHALEGQQTVYRLMYDLAPIVTATAAVGSPIAPVLIGWFDHEHAGADARQRLVSLLAALPGDEPMAALLDRLDRRYVPPAVTEMLRRFPVRGVRLLSAPAEGRSPAAREAATLLRAHVLANPAAVEAALPALDPPQRERIERIHADTSALPVAGPDQLPPVLVSPPWSVRRPRIDPPVVGEMERPAGSAMDWLPGERERWAAVVPRWSGYWNGNDLSMLAAKIAAGRADSREQIYFFVRATGELARPLLPAWRPDESWGADEWMSRLVGRYELDALPTALHLARTAPKSVGEVLLPYADGEVADLMADWLDRLKTARPVARAWLRRHPEYAVRALLPAALGAPGPRRRAAERALRLVAAEHREVLLGVAREHGEEALAAATAMLDADPLAQLPARMPSLPVWLDPAVLPHVLLRDRSAALPADAIRHVCTMLAISPPGEPYPGVEIVRAACDTDSLAEFAWALFESWQSAGAPSKDGWAFTGLGLLGDDSTARRLAPLVRAWPGESQHARAVTGLEVLAQIGTDVALMHLYGISQKVKFRGLREQAARKVGEVADVLGLTPEQLGDRLVPDLGLDADGSLVLDYGPRRFTVGFDEQLKPYVVDGAGARRKDLPKPGARDDATLAPAAHKRFAGLKKDVRTLAADQIRRFETAMVTGRRWPAADFRHYFLSHPLLWHVVRRLVWATVDGSGQVGTAFRVAEDRTLADVDDETYALPDDATVTIAHPLHLGAAVPAWAEVFADYEILQPFPQLGREVHRLDEAERTEKLLHRHMGVTVPAGRLLSLERRGWRRGTPQDAGIQSWLEREVPGGRAVVIDLDPGIAVGIVDMFPDQKIEAVWVNDVPYGDWFQRGGKVRLRDLDDVTVSEVLRDLAEVTR